jgi:hypothetical protein
MAPIRTPAPVPRRALPPATDRDLYLVLLAHADGDFVPETTLASATAERVAAAIFDGEHERIIGVVRCQPAAGTAAVADAEIAEIMSALSFMRLATPSNTARGWIEAYGFAFYEEDWYRAGRRR